MALKVAAVRVARRAVDPTVRLVALAANPVVPRAARPVRKAARAATVLLARM